jgi:hypothetical protein
MSSPRRMPGSGLLIFLDAGMRRGDAPRLVQNRLNNFQAEQIWQ